MRRQRMFGFPVLVTLALVIVQHVSSAQIVAPAPSAPTAQGSSGTDQVFAAAEILDRMDSARSTVRRMLEEARKQRDVIKTLCLDDKLNQIDVALRNARDHKGFYDDAVKKNDLDLATREMTVLNVLRQRSEQIVSEANTCVSKEAETVGPAALIADIDPNIADEPAYYPPGIIIIEPPPTGSVIK
ncbi:MAG TPA: hypothetical protein PK156_24715 [Polyangium sp.]|nr:hypothetical protein [Polyangium sp.]